MFAQVARFCQIWSHCSGGGGGCINPHLEILMVEDGLEGRGSRAQNILFRRTVSIVDLAQSAEWFGGAC